MVQLIKEQDGKRYTKETRLVNDPGNLKGLLNDTRWEILSLLAERPRYPAAIAGELDMHEQKVYYHIRKLKENNIIEVASQEVRGGSVAKYYQPTSHTFTLELPHGDDHLAAVPIDERKENLRTFLRPFISNGTINARIIVGSPDPHGPHQVRGKDGHYAIDLAALLGRYGTLEHSLPRLDIDINSPDDYRNNLILVGGPLTNVITSEFNPYMPVSFEQEEFPYHRITSDQTGNEYSDETIGLIAKLRNPESPEHFALVLAGIRNSGTMAAAMALCDHHDELLRDYEAEENWASVVRGKDMDGDGTIDQIDILE
jgi:DNA-binding transcriptional ArsR family regulator